MKVDGRLQGSSLPVMWKFGEWVMGGGKVYRVTNIDLGKHQLKKESELVDVKETKGKQFLKVLCRITLLPFLVGWIVRQTYRSRFTLIEDAPRENINAKPIEPRSIVSNKEQAIDVKPVSTKVKEVAPIHHEPVVKLTANRVEEAARPMLVFEFPDQHKNPEVPKPVQTGKMEQMPLKEAQNPEQPKAVTAQNSLFTLFAPPTPTIPLFQKYEAPKPESPKIDEAEVNKNAEQFGKALKLTGKDLELFKSLAREGDFQKREELLKELIRSRPDLEGRISKSKNGHKRLLLWLKNSPLGEGSYFCAYRAIQVGGKNVGAFKQKVALVKNPDSRSKEATIEENATKNIECSDWLQQKAKGTPYGVYFIKYKRFVKGETGHLHKADLAEGGDFFSDALKARCKDDQQFRSQAIRRLLEACEFMEKSGASHNDLKPENLFLKNGALVIGDYGLMAKEGENKGGAGTLGYMPPDLNSHPINLSPSEKKHDNFSVGMIFLEMLLGRKEGVAFDLRGKTNQLLQGLERIRSKAPAIEAIIGLLQPETKDRITFAKALEIMEGHYGKEQAILAEVQKVVDGIIGPEK